ncbi:MAG: carboxypeptidase-like regulatory domain-containing protein [Bacteroidales bacterium]|nr:carboxypeptidase-like regulatory domain-containing protein [Bacteroidales bacterium]MDD4030227.1 carboxypeptidase-like regulatory domain-containing protein [Bacteroidales bacterium]MDD4435135.1 carboxypeptidase-like regulatory domain-containing protein [Bacteroidales bacterium]
MKHILALLLLLMLSNQSVTGQDTTRIYGTVTDFEGNPVKNAVVRVKDKSFNNLYECFTDSLGNYALTVLKRPYYCIYSIRLDDYGKTRLEYWMWNIPALDELVVNPKYERMELYGLNAFEPQVGPHNTYMIYFRPMSLTISDEFQAGRSKAVAESQANQKGDIIDIAPESISKEELVINVNGVESQVVSINKVLEYARGAYMYGYIVQVIKPENDSGGFDGYDRISIVLHSKQTNEIGMSECFVKRTDDNEVNIPISGRELISRMHSKYNKKFFRSLSFSQEVINYKDQKVKSTEIMHEAYLSPGRLILKFRDWDSGDGLIFRNDSLYTIENGRVIKEESRIHDLLLLCFDVYNIAPGITTGKLETQNYNLDLITVDHWLGQKAWRVGDVNGNCFWINSESLLLMKVQMKNSDRARSVRFANYQVINNVPIATQIEFYDAAGNLEMVEKYYDIKPFNKLEDNIFNPSDFFLSKW